MSNNEQKMQHLEFIQNVITRMNTNSFQLKELTILIITACMAIYASNTIPLMLLIPIIPTCALWGLDTYYLQQERKFRSLYNDITNTTDKPIHTPKLYEITIKPYTAEKNSMLSYWRVFFSPTIVLFYCPLIVILLVLFLLLQIKCIFVIL